MLDRVFMLHLGMHCLYLYPLTHIQIIRVCRRRDNRVSSDKLSGGCNGGFPATALLFSNTNLHGGMSILNDYPYTDGNNGETTAPCDI
jgi:hypothetical protein